jgi:three-Cys-motif partner protein
MKSKNRNLFYIDLYAGDGICECDEAPLKKWDPPYFRNIEECNKKNIDIKCIFNDLNNMDLLSKKLHPYKKNIIKTYKENANDVIDNIFKLIPPEEWSIFMLDPCLHKDLSFQTIEKISKHEIFDSISRCVRKPEMIITFMTYSMQQYLKTVGRDDVSEEKKEEFFLSIDKSLGTDIWREKILNKKSVEREDKTHKIFLDIFLKQLGNLGYDTVYFHICQTQWNSVVYFLIFATSVPTAYSIISKKFEPYINRIKKDVWIKENFNFYKMAKAKEQGIKLLDDFI